MDTVKLIERWETPKYKLVFFKINERCFSLGLCIKETQEWTRTVYEDVETAYDAFKEKIIELREKSRK